MRVKAAETDNINILSHSHFNGIAVSTKHHSRQNVFQILWICAEYLRQDDRAILAEVMNCTLYIIVTKSHNSSRQCHSCMYKSIYQIGKGTWTLLHLYRKIHIWRGSNNSSFLMLISLWWQKTNKTTVKSTVCLLHIAKYHFHLLAHTSKSQHVHMNNSKN